MNKELDYLYCQIHWLFDQISLLQVRVRKLEEANYAKI